MADVGQHWIDGAVLNGSVTRVLGGLLVLTVYVSVLGSSEIGSPGDDVGAEQSLEASADAFAASRYADALQPTLAVMRAFPNQPVYAERAATIYQHLDRPTDEAAAWESVALLSATPVDVCPALPIAYARSGDPAKALDAYQRCVTFDPENVDMIFSLALAQERAGHSAVAEAGYRDILRIAPAHADSLLGLARFDLKAGRLEEAELAAVAVLEALPDNADALLIAGTAAQRLGRKADARRFLERAVAVSEWYVDVHIALGVLDFSEGRVKEARGHFGRAVQLEPQRRPELTVWLQRTGWTP